jgi:hypothetical protein
MRAAAIVRFSALHAALDLEASACRAIDTTVRLIDIILMS